MGHTMTEKLLARAAGVEGSTPGDVVLAQISMLTNPDWDAIYRSASR